MEKEVLNKIPGISGYVVIKGEDGAVAEMGGASTSPISDLVAFFSSATEVIKNSLSLGKINYTSLCYGANRLVIFPYENNYLGVEVQRERDPLEVIDKIKESIKVAAKPKIELPRSISSKVQQINLLIDEFGGIADKEHWLEFLSQGIGILGGDLLPFIGVIDGEFQFKAKPSKEKEEDFVQGLRSIIDFLVKKSVEEMGSSAARAKVQAVIERMR